LTILRPLLGVYFASEVTSCSEIKPRRATAGTADLIRPRALLTKLSAGKTTQAYLTDESVFSQGDAADAVFYIQSGKEAVIAILPHSSFFGEGCLAGQPLRMSTASTDQKSTIVRIEKSAMVAMLHPKPEFAEGFLTYLPSRNVRIGSR
jgi:CRP/FNR family transcriptional regulator, cyclic AMP receptor protein